MAYQKCPVCSGTGKLLTYPSAEPKSITPLVEICHACAGNGIISELTGLPPSNPLKPTK